MTGETASAAAACAGTSRWPGAASSASSSPRICSSVTDTRPAIFFCAA